MAVASLSPMEKILEKKKIQKTLSAKIYEKIFDLGVCQTAEFFEITPHETVKLIIKVAGKNNETAKLQELSNKETITAICDKIMELRTYSTEKIYEECKSFAKSWEIIIAKSILKEKLKREYPINE